MSDAALADADLAAIEATVQTYLDALHAGDADRLASVFLPTSALTQVMDGTVRVTPRDAWLDLVRSRPSPAAQGLPRHDRILMLDRIGPTLASAKVQCAIPPRFFVDVLSLLKVEGRWQVAQKVFMTDLRG